MVLSAHFSLITGKEGADRWADSVRRASAVMKKLIDAA